MRCVIARFPFELTRDGVIAALKGVKPEPIVRESVTIARRRYPLMQVGQVVTRQDRRDFSAGEVWRAMERLGFTCHASEGQDSTPAPAPGASALEQASAALGGAETERPSAP